jgi:hypothetical protein
LGKKTGMNEIRKQVDRETSIQGGLGRRDDLDIASMNKP